MGYLIITRVPLQAAQQRCDKRMKFPKVLGHFSQIFLEPTLHFINAERLTVHKLEEFRLYLTNLLGFLQYRFGDLMRDSE